MDRLRWGSDAPASGFHRCSITVPALRHRSQEEVGDSQRSCGARKGAGRSLPELGSPKPRQGIRQTPPKCSENGWIVSAADESNQKRRRSAALKSLIFLEIFGAGEGIRTLDPNLGKVVLY